jgi:DNA-directed RNA polymerase specialized sigma24 family protein
MSSADDSKRPSVAGLAALGRVLHEYRPRLLAMLQRQIDRGLGARVDPEDVFQDACLDAKRRWPEFERLQQEQPDASAYVWLYGLVRDRLIDRWREATRTRRDLRREVPWPDRSSDQLGCNLMDTGTGPSSAAADALDTAHARGIFHRDVKLVRHHPR